MKLMAATVMLLACALCALALPAAGAAPVAKDVAFEGAGGFVLRGTLLLPDVPAGNKAPAMLLLPGSGPTDRNGNQPPLFVTDLLKQIAQRLAKDGIATLRFDKRAAHVCAADWPKTLAAQNDFFRWESFVGDAKAAYLWLRARPEVDPTRVGILGHSEGSLIAQAVASELHGAQAPAALVLAGAMGRPLGTVMDEQVARSARAGLPPDEAEKFIRQEQAATAQVVKSGAVPTDLDPRLRPLYPPNATKYLRTVLPLDPTKLAADFAGPVLILQGEKDIQVSAARDTPLLEKALRARKSGSSDVFVVPGASHNLKAVGDVKTDPGFAGPVVPAALDRLTAWLKAHLAR